MSFLYRIFISLYAFIIRLSAFFNTKAKKWVDGRKDIFLKIGSSITKHENEKKIWFHCSSLGEYEQGKPVLDTVCKKYPQHKIILTFFSPSGYENVVKKERHLLVHYLPLDTKKNAEKFISLCKPDFAVFVKYEFWFHYINELHKKNIPLYVISAIFRPKQYFFKWYGKAFRKRLKQVHAFFVQNKTSKDLLHKYGFENVLVSGDTRFDRVTAILKEKKEFPEIEDFVKSSKVVLGGSTWPEDEKLLISLLDEKQQALKIIIAPHEINPERIEKIIKDSSFSSVRYTDLLKKTDTNADVLIIDSIGILKFLYKYCDIAFIGGGFGVGIHNTLEAAVFGKPILFGPNYNKFKEAKDLIERKAAFSISSEKDLKEYFFRIFKNEDFYQKTAAASQKYVEENIGATKIIVERIHKNLV